MTFKELSSANKIRCTQSFHSIEEWSESEWACALAGEVGELCNMIKKRHRGESISVLELGKELADIVIYADLLSQKLNLSLEEEIKYKFNEVSERVGSNITL